MSIGNQIFSTSVMVSEVESDNRVFFGLAARVDEGDSYYDVNMHVTNRSPHDNG